jgi:phage baseplate assembly protein W
MSRASVQTPYRKQPELFSDFLGNLDLHPMSGDLARVVNEESIKQSIKNLILTNFGERLFNPTAGSNVYNTLFQPLDDFTVNDIKNYISETIKFNEPRANLISIDVKYDDNTLKTAITFSIINTNTTSTLNLILRRVR